LQILVPTAACGYSVSTYDPGSLSETIDWPGATRSTWRLLDPREENAGTVSSRLVAVPLVSSAPTATTYGSVAGLSSDGWLLPLLPPATTTTMPARHAFSTAAASGS